MRGGDGSIQLSTRRTTSSPGRRRRRFLATNTGSQLIAFVMLFAQGAGA